jgi:hypothetical protein
MIALDSSAFTCKLKQVGNPEKHAKETIEESEPTVRKVCGPSSFSRNTRRASILACLHARHARKQVNSLLDWLCVVCLKFKQTTKVLSNVSITSALS